MYDPDAVRKRYGIFPAQIPDFLALVGDSVDNIPGAKGIGEKTAPMLIREYGSVEQMLNAPEKLPTRWRSKIEQSADAVRLSKRLVVLDTAVDTRVKLEDLAWPGRERTHSVDSFDRVRKPVSYPLSLA